MTVTVLAVPMLVGASPAAAAPGSNSCSIGFFCGASGPPGAWQVDVNANGTSPYAYPGMFVGRNGNGSFTISWFGFFSRIARVFCQGVGPVSEEGQGGGGGGVVAEGVPASSGYGTGTTTVQFPQGVPFFCEVVAEQ